MGKKKSFIILLILAILATGGVICMNSDISIQKNYKKPVRFKKLKYRKFNIEDEYIKEIVNSESSAEKKIPYEYKINKKGVLIGSAIGDDLQSLSYPNNPLPLQPQVHTDLSSFIASTVPVSF